ncbi:MAG: hypothetical protein ACRDCN_15460 [Tannerellaceae bacterium]
MKTKNEVREGWVRVLKSIFPQGLPKSCEWTDQQIIHNLLHIISTEEQSNHLFFPSGGGMNLAGAKYSGEYKCMELTNASGGASVIKPAKLTFHSFGKAGIEWSYFRIEAADLKPTGIYANTNGIYEEVCEIEPVDYISTKHWMENEYQGERLPSDARLVMRFLGGSIVIFANASPYNYNTGTYDARHNAMSDQEFRQYIEDVTTCKIAFE